MKNIQPFDWDITIKAPFGGLSPRYYRNPNATYGSANQFNVLSNIDLSDLNCIKQGAGLADFSIINTDNSNTYEKMVQIIDYEVATNKTYAISATYIWEINWATKTATMIHKLPTGAIGESLIVYGAHLYYAYNTASAADIGQWDFSTTWDDDWGSTRPATPANVFKKGAHPMIVADNILVIGNGQYMGLYDGTALFMNEADFKADATISAIVTTEHQTYVAVNRPSGAVIAIFNNSFDYLDENGDPQAFGPIDSKFIGGKIYNLFVNEGIIYIFHLKPSDDAFRVSYLSGSKASKITSISGTAPIYNQVTWYKEFLTYIVDNKIYQTGQQEANLSLIDNITNSVTGASTIANPFGTLLIANATKLQYESGIATGSATTLTFNCGNVNHDGMIDVMHVRTNKLPAGASATIKIKRNLDDGDIITLDAISGENKSYHEYPSVNIENLQSFNLTLDFVSGVEVQEIYIKGHTN